MTIHIQSYDGLMKFLLHYRNKLMTVATAWQQVVVDFEAFLLPSSTLLKSHDTYCKHLNLHKGGNYFIFNWVLSGDFSKG